MRCAVLQCRRSLLDACLSLLQPGVGVVSEALESNTPEHWLVFPDDTGQVDAVVCSPIPY